MRSPHNLTLDRLLDSVRPDRTGGFADVGGHKSLTGRRKLGGIFVIAEFRLVRSRCSTSMRLTAHSRKRRLPSRRSALQIENGSFCRMPVRGYRCPTFRQCPARDECSRNRQGRLIEISPYDAAVERQWAKLRDSEKQQLLKRRKVIVEPAFGGHQAGRGVSTLDSARAGKRPHPMVDGLRAFNLKKMYKSWTAGELVLG
jgi:DDE family transposase